MKYVKPEIISLKNNSEFNEKWLQAKIEEDPSIIGLGDLEFRDTEKIQVGGGRLDTILYDPEDKRRYEVEIQLGKQTKVISLEQLNIGIGNERKIPNTNIVL